MRNRFRGVPSHPDKMDNRSGVANVGSNPSASTIMTILFFIIGCFIYYFFVKGIPAESLKAFVEEENKKKEYIVSEKRNKLIKKIIK
jgi:hypothetical protein